MISSDAESQSVAELDADGARCLLPDVLVRIFQMMLWSGCRRPSTSCFWRRILS